MVEILSFSQLELFSFIDDPLRLDDDGFIIRRAYFGREFTHRQPVNESCPFLDSELVHVGKILESAITEWRQTPEQLGDELMLTSGRRRRESDLLCAS